MVTIATLADIHIHNLKFHKEYLTIFDELYQKLLEIKVDYIVILGDIAHSKTNISPEFVEICGNFFRNLSNIAETFIICGNHDLPMKNTDRQDAISPIVSALGLPNLHLLKKSQEVPLSGTDITLNALAIDDRKGWLLTPSNPSRTNIALYHGAIKGSKTDVGWAMEKGDDDISIFNNFDYAWLGDIHKTNQILDDAGKIRYPGCLVQNNFGESDDKGFLVWKIRGKDDYDCRHIKLTNPHPFINVDVDQDGKVLTTQIPNEARVRIVSDFTLSYEQTRKVADYLSFNFKPHSTFFAPKINISENKINIISNLQKKNLRDIGVQEELIREFLKPNNLTTETIDQVLELNKRYSVDVSQKESVQRNSVYEILDFEFSNFFNYGENNFINISTLKDVVGLFGNNASGKSSLVEALIYTIFGSTAKNTRKLKDLINYAKETASGRVRIKMDEKIFIIDRKLEKYDKKTKGGVVQEAKCFIDFKVLENDEEVSLNGDTTPDTDANIRKLFGTIEDFVLTQFSPQFGSLSYIEEGSTKRKEIVSKFLDIDFLEQKHDLAKEDANFIKKSLKEFEGKDHLKEIDLLKNSIETNKEHIQNEKALLESKDALIFDKKKEIAETMAGPDETIDLDIEKIERDIVKFKAEAERVEKTTAGLLASLETNKQAAKEHNKVLEGNDASSLRAEKNDLEEKIEVFRDVSSKEKQQEIILSGLKKEIIRLDEVPCGDQFPGCKFIKSAHEAKSNINIVEMALDNLREQKAGIEIKEETSRLSRIDELLRKIEGALTAVNRLEKNLNDAENSISKNELLKDKISAKLAELSAQKDKFEQNQEKYLEISKKNALREQKETELKALEDERAIINKKIENLLVMAGSFKQKLQNLFTEYQKKRELEKNYEAYQYFLKCFHSNGIPFEVIKGTLGALNAEIKATLSKFVKFDVFFETEDNKLNILFNKGNQAVPIENCSGAEKVISAFAIRLALTSLSTLPKTSLFILDEPAESLDKNYLDAFVKVLDIIKDAFKSVILISHLDVLKEVPSSHLDIMKNNGYAAVRYE